MYNWNILGPGIEMRISWEYSRDMMGYNRCGCISSRKLGMS